MKRVHLPVVFVAATLVWASTAFSQTPPSAAAPAESDAAGAPSDGDADAADYAPPPSGGAISPEAQLEAERLKVWNSPEMQKARALIEEYGRRSRRFNSVAAQQYLERVRRLSPSAMRTWLEQFTARRDSIARSGAAASAARQTAVGYALSRQQAWQRARANADLAQTQGALAAQDELLLQRQFAEERSAINQAGRRDFLTDMYARDYTWLAFPDYRTRAAAAATLPGDLPPGDPRNFTVAGPDVVGPNGEAVNVGAAATAAAGGAAGGGAAGAGGAGGGGGPE